MRIVIPGGTGLIGRALIDSLVADGHEPVVLTRSPHDADPFPSGVSLVQWDGEHAGDWVRSLDGADAVVHLAGLNVASGFWTEERKRKIRNSRVDSSRAISAAFPLVDEPPPVLVQASAAGYYGDRDDEVLTEDTPSGDDFLASVCREWEAASASVEELGVRRPLLRTGLVLSMDDGLLPLMAMPFRIGVGGPVGSGEQWMPWIHVDDEVGAIRFLIDRDETDGPYNLSAPEPVTNEEFSRALAEALDKPCLLRAPGWAVKLLGGQLGELALVSQRMVPRQLLDAGYEFSYIDIDAALEDLVRSG